MSVANSTMFQMVDPNSAVIEDNVRTAPNLDADFIESVRSGVLVPVLAYRDDEGRVVVRDGQRRTLAAREAGLAEIPAYIVDAQAADVDRMAEQIITNEHRAPLTRRQHTQAVQQLHLAGLSPTRIAKRLSRKKSDVDHALAVAKSNSALETLENTPELTLEQAAVLAQWEHDDDAFQQLLDAAPKGLFEHTAEVLEQSREARALIAEEGKRLDAEGICWSRKVLSHPWYRLIMFVTADGNAADPDTIPAESKIAVVTAEEEHDPEWRTTGGDLVDGSAVDWTLLDDSDPDATPQEGLIDPRTLVRTPILAPQVTWFIRNPSELELEQKSRWQWRNRKTSALTETQLQQQKEAERIARRRTVALNKLAVSAQAVRRQKATEWLTRSRLPKETLADAHAFITATMWHRHSLLGQARAAGSTSAIASEFLGLDDLAGAAATATETRVQVINFALALAAHEAAIEKDSWRPDSYQREAIRAYFRVLSDVTGYVLSPIEEAMAGDISPDEIVVE